MMFGFDLRLTPKNEKNENSWRVIHVQSGSSSKVEESRNAIIHICTKYTVDFAKKDHRVKRILKVSRLIPRKRSAHVQN